MGPEDRAWVALDGWIVRLDGGTAVPIEDPLPALTLEDPDPDEVGRTVGDRLGRYQRSE